MSEDGLRVVQITDFHLLADAGERLHEVDTHATLAAVIERVRAEAPDLVLATGDLSQDGLLGSYRRVKTLLRRLDAPVYCLPGNHDDATRFAAAMPGEGVHVARELCRNGWQIVFLDSTVPGEEDGRLADGELDALDRALDARPGLHALVCLHHHPVAVGGAWGDSVSLANADDLFAMLDRHPQVRGLLWGHVHQPFEDTRGAVRLMATPSTCFQFAPGPAGSLAVGPEPPAYRRLALGPDGAIDTELRWLDRLAVSP